MIKIGITTNLRRSIWSSGVNQNALYLAKLLKLIGYNVYLIHDSDKTEKVNDIDIVKIDDSYKLNFSLIIQLGLIVSDSFIDKHRKVNKYVKLLHYKCGNDFLIDMESILFNDNESRTESFSDINNRQAKQDKIRIIPQNEKI